MPALTSAQRQARRLALFNGKCTSAGWRSWRELVTYAINGAIDMPQMTRTAVARFAANRVTNSPKLVPHRAVLLDYDWPNMDEHLNWVARAHESEIMDWIETLEAEASDPDRQS